MLIKLTRDAVAFPDSHEANVHPDDVAAWEANGWKVAADRALADLSVKELKALAQEKGIDLGDATKKDDIVAAIELAAEAAPAA